METKKTLQQSYFLFVQWFWPSGRVCFILLLMTLLSLPIGWSAQARTVKYEGLSPEFVIEIEKKFPQLKSKKITYEDTDEVIRYIMKRSKFKSVSVYVEDNNGLVIVANSVRKISRIEVSGNAFLSDWKVKTILQLKEGEVFDRLKVIKAGERLKEEYGKQGYFNSVITAVFEAKGKKGQAVIFKIEENQPCIIKTITVESSNRSLQNSIKSRFSKYSNKAFTEEVLGQINYTANDYFQKYRYIKGSLNQKSVRYNKDKTEAHLTYEVGYPYKFEIYFQGNEALSQSDLFRATDLKTINKQTLNPAREIVERVRKQYLIDGYANIRINYNIEEDTKEFKRKIKVSIEEGHRVKIGSLKFSGHISRPSKYYSEFVRKNSTELIERGYYNREDLKLSFDNLTTHLKNQGYLHAKVRSVRMDYNKRKDQATIAVDLDEGPLTQVRRIRFKGIKAFQRIELEKLLLVSSNAPLHLKDLEESLIRISDHYKAHGYLEATVSKKRDKLVRYNKSETQADILFDIYEGPKVVVDGIRIEGNVHINDDVILRESEFEKGQTLTPELILEANGRLNKLQIFSSVEIDTNNKFTSLSKRTVIIKVSERKPGLFKVGTGFTDENELTIHGFTGVSFLWPTTRAISTRAEISESIAQAQFLEHKITVGYLEPYLFNSDWKGRINITRQVKVDEYFEDIKSTLTDEENSTILETNKLAFLLERNITARLKFIWNLWTQELNRSFLDDPSRTVFIKGKAFKASDQRIPTIGPAFDYDARNNPWLPSKGYLLRWNMDYSAPDIGSSDLINFVRTQAQANKYLNFGSTVWANSLRVGYAKNLSSEDNSGIPKSHAFFLGGISSVRGFSGNSNLEVIPNRSELPVVDGSNDLIVSDQTTFFLIKSELRFQIWKDFGMALFYDGGRVDVSQIDYTDPARPSKAVDQKKPYRDAVGFGFRYNTPVGPVSLDVGFKLDPQEGEDKFRIHFSFGTW